LTGRETNADEIPEDDGTPAGETDSAVTEAGLKPSTMRGSEPRYALGVAVILLVVAVLNFAIRHGKGAPKHPSTGLEVLGLVAALAVFPLLRTNNRFIVPFGSVVAAFFVTLPSGPNSIKSLHVLAIIFPLAFALVLTQRQRKAALANARSRAVSRSAGAAAPARARRSGRRRKEEQPSGPTANRRYTPPKPKRARR
jgi:hypothetical protein